MNAGSLLVVVAAVAAVGAALGWFLNNRLGARSLVAARLKGEEIQRAASREAENVKRQQLVEARDQILREKSKADSDLRSRKGQVAKRERDLKNEFVAPFSPSWRNSRDVLLKPAWLADIARHGVPEMKNLAGMVRWSTKITDIAASVGRELDASFDWEQLKEIRDAWPGKLVLKGVERADDAERAAALGCDGVVVSNHGGRQLDGAQATLDALPAVARAVGSKITVLLDGGVRRGVDILKARALGARAVLTGRATLFGVMAGGEAGAKRAIDILGGEFERAMQLGGVARAEDIGPDLLA